MSTRHLRTIVRTIVGTSLMASAIGMSAMIGAVGTANAAPSTPLPSSYTCYDYATQVFYDC